MSDCIKLKAGLGTFMLDSAEAERSVFAALKNRYKLIDTANAYMNEEETGNAIRKSGIPREEIFLTSKVWVEHYGYEEGSS